ncbi:MAG TPA: HEAT repeat domain-containing protein [Povalibacter sp.]|uniref:HEAT repeat domain-containing protein n=1 Tax=Povalibacter sp. TaxID=1962978 RepID=UPI002B8FDD1B|nr:HEAT repeat domain-containing protein [Povalibacter sp.]HMN46746.1 HEAT repeat domain-containing protein [Povalibacter sp.]
MLRPSVVLVAAACVAISVVLLSLNRPGEVGKPAASTLISPPAALPEQPEPAEVHAPLPTTEIDDVRAVDVLHGDTQSPDARTRADAIAELSRSTDPRAVGVLRRVLDDGDPQVDQPLALQSLQKLALERGDEDGAIRDALRYTVYHATDESVTQTAQLMLEDLDARLASAAR